jgi:long-chain acyl-CoA synthetase
MGVTLNSVIDSWADKKKETALIFFADEDAARYSYHELYRDVVALAHGILKEGLTEKRKQIAVMSSNRYEWIVAALAIIRAGGILVPIDVQSDDETVTHILENSECCTILTESDQLRRLKNLGGDDLKIYVVDKPDDNASSDIFWKVLFDKKERELPQAQPDDLVILFYTSGTTGKPKGVPLAHRQVGFQINAINESSIICPADRLLLPLPLHHVYPLIVGLLCPLSNGISIAFPKSLTGTQIIRGLREGEITIVVGVPRLYQALLQGIDDRIKTSGMLTKLIGQSLMGLSVFLLKYFRIRAGKKLLGFLHSRTAPHLRLLASGGSALSVQTHTRLEALGWQVAIGYGLTETAPLLTINYPEVSRYGSAGQVIQGVDLVINQDDPERPDEILVKGPNVFNGYWHMSDKNKNVFTDEGWFKTGDMGRLDDGFLYLTGRVSTLIVTESGKNIQPDEVEVVFEQDPLIAEIGIFKKENKLVGIVVPDQDALLQRKKEEASEIISQAITKRHDVLPTYKRLSDYAVTYESIPRTRLGKIRRHLLAGIYDRIKSDATDEKRKSSKPIPISEMTGEDQNLLEDRTAKAVWNLLAKKYQDRRLTPDTSTQLELGIDSMEWINLSLEIRHRIGVELNEEAINRIKLVRDLLQEVAGQSLAGATKEDNVAKLIDDPERMIQDHQKKWISSHGPFLKGALWGLHMIDVVLMRSLYHLSIEGRQNLPLQRPYILAANHVSYLDPFAIAAALDNVTLQQTYWAGWTGVAFTNLLTRSLSRVTQVIPIDSERGAISSLAFVAAVLKRQQNLVLFPEGERSEDGELLRFKPGLGLLLKHVNVPIVPVIISGTYKAWPVRQKLPRLRPLRVAFGTPIAAKELRNEDVHNMTPDEMMMSLHQQMKILQEEQVRKSSDSN